MEIYTKSEDFGELSPDDDDDGEAIPMSRLKVFQDDLPRTSASQPNITILKEKDELELASQQTDDKMESSNLRLRSRSWPDVALKWINVDEMAKYSTTRFVVTADVEHTDLPGPSNKLKEKDMESESLDFDSGPQRQRSWTWPGNEQASPLPGMTAYRSAYDRDFKVYYLDDAKVAKHYGDIKQPRMRYRPPCICRPEQPPSSVCMTMEEEEAEYEERVNYCKICLTWMAFAAKVALFFSLWALLLYWFLMSGGFINVRPARVELPKDLNTYIDKDQPFKFLIINNTSPYVDLEVKLLGPFGSSNVFFNVQFERLYYNNNKFNRMDVKIKDALDIEVDHNIYRDSYSAVTTTWFTTRVQKTTMIKSTTVSARLTRYNLSRHQMTSFQVTFPYNFVPWRENEMKWYGYSFDNFKDGSLIGGRRYGHRHYANKTSNDGLTVIYGLKYSLNMSTQKDLDNKKDLNSVAFAIQVTKGIDPRYTTTTTTPPPPIPVYPSDCNKYTLILLGLLTALLFLQANRMLALFTIGIACLSILSYLNVRPHADTTVPWLQMDYLFELIFAMTCIAVAMETGIIDFISVAFYRLTNGFFLLICPLLCAATFCLCLAMDNVVAVLIMNPIAIRTLEEGHLNPKPVLMSMILYANIAGVLDRDYSYFNYAMHKGREKWEATEGAFVAVSYSGTMMNGVGLCVATTTAYLAFIFLFVRPHKYYNPQVAEMIHEQLLLRMAASSIHRASCHWDTVRRDLIEWYHDIERAKLRILNNVDASSQIQRMPVKFDRITDYNLLLKLGFTLLVFFLMVYFKRTNTYGLGVTHIGWMVVICTGVLLILVNPSDMNVLLSRIDWSTIWAFMAMFFFEMTLNTFELHDNIWNDMKDHFTKENDIYYMTSLGVQNLLWLTAIMSCFITNFAAASILIQLGIKFGNIVQLERIPYIVWALTFGANVGGSATLLGTGVAIASAASAWQQGYRLGAWRYVVFCLPITVINMVVLFTYWTVMRHSITYDSPK